MSKAIVLVEDYPSDEKLTLRAFQRGGLSDAIVVLRDGAEALEYLHGKDARRHHHRPSLVLLDLKLPCIDGLEVLRRIRAHEHTRHLPVVVLTASGEVEDVARSYALGANAYVRKPVDFTEFVDTARTLAKFWTTLNEVVPDGRGRE